MVFELNFAPPTPFFALGTCSWLFQNRYLEPVIFSQLFSDFSVEVKQGIGGFLSVGSFQLVFHACFLEMVKNQCPFQGQQ